MIRTLGSRSRARATELAVLYRGGCTLTEIADAIGLSPERVRQLVRRVGEPSLGMRPAHAAPLVWRVERPRERIRLGIAGAEYRRQLVERRCERFALAVDALRWLASELGRRPTIGELTAALDLRIYGQGTQSPALQEWLNSHAAHGRFRDLTFALYDTAGLRAARRSRELRGRAA